MQNNQKYLYTLKQGKKFIQNNKIHTVYQHSGNMSEIYVNNRFYTWPNWDGVKGIKVTPYTPAFV